MNLSNHTGPARMLDATTSAHPVTTHATIYIGVEPGRPNLSVTLQWLCKDEGWDVLARRRGNERACSFRLVLTLVLMLFSVAIVLRVIGLLPCQRSPVHTASVSPAAAQEFRAALGPLPIDRNMRSQFRSAVLACSAYSDSTLRTRLIPDFRL